MSDSRREFLKKSAAIAGGAVAVSAGLAVLMVEQHVHLALKYARRGYVLAGGRVRTRGTAAELRERWSEIESSYLGR